MLTNLETLCVSPQSTIQHAITQMNASRAGIVLVVDEDTEAPKWPIGTRLGLNIQDRVGFLLAQIDILEQALRNRKSMIPAKGSRV